jgi:hypothetical protein
LERVATLHELVELYVTRNDLHEVVEHSIIDGVPHFKCTIPGCTKDDPIPVRYYPEHKRFSNYHYRKHLTECHPVDSEDEDEEEDPASSSEKESKDWRLTRRKRLEEHGIVWSSTEKAGERITCKFCNHLFKQSTGDMYQNLLQHIDSDAHFNKVQQSKRQTSMLDFVIVAREHPPLKQ